MIQDANTNKRYVGPLTPSELEQIEHARLVEVDAADNHRNIVMSGELRARSG